MDTVCVQALRGIDRVEFRLKHHWNYRMLTRQQSESGCCHQLSKKLRVLVQARELKELTFLSFARCGEHLLCAQKNYNPE